MDNKWRSGKLQEICQIMLQEDKTINVRKGRDVWNQQLGNENLEGHKTETTERKK